LWKGTKRREGALFPPRRGPSSPKRGRVFSGVFPCSLPPTTPPYLLNTSTTTQPLTHQRTTLNTTHPPPNTTNTPPNQTQTAPSHQPTPPPLPSPPSLLSTPPPPTIKKPNTYNTLKHHPTHNKKNTHKNTPKRLQDNQEWRSIPSSFGQGTPLPSRGEVVNQGKTAPSLLPPLSRKKER